MSSHQRNAIIIVASVLIAAGVSAIISPKLSHFVAPLFSLQIPGVSADLIASKSFDLTEFGITFILSLVFGAVNLLVFKEADQKTDLGIWCLSALGVITFLLTRFATYSGKVVIGVVGLAELLIALGIWASRRTKPTESISHLDLNLGLFNGIFLGFYVLLVLNRLTPIVIIPLSVLILLPIGNWWLIRISQAWSQIIPYFPAVLLPVVLLFPTNLGKLLVWGIVALVIWGLSAYFKKTILSAKILSTYVLPVMIVVLVAYNPTFGIGNFDSVEEGFWSGWIQRLSQHQSLYKDVSVYQPPALIWGLYIFEKIWGYSLLSQRLFMHILQVVGAVIYLFFVKKIVKAPWVVVFLMLCFFGLTSTNVKNNVEIRVGIGLVSLIALSKASLPLAGATTALALFSSIEVGLAAMVSSVIFVVIRGQNKLRNLALWLGGVIMGSLPFLLIMAWQKSLWGLVSQVSSYASIFAKGYFNTPVDRAISLSFFHWHIFNQYFGSPAMWFEIIKIVIFAMIIYEIYKKLTGKFDEHDNFLLSIGIFALVLSRVALGRSDYLHLLFPLLVVMALVGYAIDSLLKNKSQAAIVIAVLVIFLGARDAINSVFMENLVSRLQTFGTPVGEYYSYEVDRGKGILQDSKVITDSENELIAYVQANTTNSDSIFTYPWYPELYFLTNRRNATRVDTPYAYYTSADQARMIAELKASKPKLIIHNSDLNFGGLTIDALSELDNYVKSHYKVTKQFGQNRVME